MSNRTIIVASEYPCNEILHVHGRDVDLIHPDPVWRTTKLGCMILEILQLMYNFEVTYLKGHRLWDEASSEYNTPPDVYTKPFPLTEVSEYVWPLKSVINRRYGFTIIWSNKQLPVMEGFFRLPFTLQSWVYILTTTFFIIAPLVYWLGLWERTVLKGKLTRRNQEYSLVYTILTVIGACCQHIPPVHPILCSRRVACLTLFSFTYVMHSFYTSNLLSHLVNDKDHAMSLKELFRSDYEFVILDYLKPSGGKKLYRLSKLKDLSEVRLMLTKLSKSKKLDIFEALNELKGNKVALLSDYITIYPYFKEVLDNEDICDIIEVDLVSNLQEYLYASKDFPLREQFKVGMLRIIETGVLKRIKKASVYATPVCNYTPDLHIGFQHIVGPLVVLALAMVFSCCVMLAEVVHQRVCARSAKLWPYVN